MRALVHISSNVPILHDIEDLNRFILRHSAVELRQEEEF